MKIDVKSIIERTVFRCFRAYLKIHIYEYLEKVFEGHSFFI